MKNETIFERKLLDSLLADFIFQHVTFKSFCESYNFKYANLSYERHKLQYKRVIDIFLAWRLSKYHDEELHSPFTSNVHDIKL